MDESIIEVGFLWFFGTLFIGPLAGWLVSLKGGFERGVAVGCLVIGLTGSYFAVTVGIDRAAQLRGTVPVQGRLVEFVKETSKESDGTVSVTYAPRVSYVAADGQERLVKGLGGSQASKEPGAPVNVRYRADNPDRALVADFQNTWGPVLAFGIFGGFPLLFGMFFLVQSIVGDAIPLAPRSLTTNDKVRLAWARYGTIAGNLILVAAFVIMGASPYDVLPSVAAGFCTVALGCLVHMGAELLRPTRVWQRLAILFIVAAGFATFGVVGLLLGLEV